MKNKKEIKLLYKNIDLSSQKLFLEPVPELLRRLSEQRAEKSDDLTLIHRTQVEKRRNLFLQVVLSPPHVFSGMYSPT